LPLDRYMEIEVLLLPDVRGEEKRNNSKLYGIKSSGRWKRI